jgi:DNA primase
LKDEIRQRIDVVDLVSEHVALKRAGRDFVGLCPFHHEKTPSFSVSPAKQIFKCFGCGAGGDVFSFIQLRESVTFIEAMRILADRAGIDFDQRIGRAPSDGLGRADLARVNAWAQETFCRAFADEQLGCVARAYVSKRKITTDMVAAFAIGWAPEDGGWLLAKARAAKLRMELLQAAGLAARGSYGEDYGVFRGRLMFPIRDTMNRVIGFGGRTLIDDRAKYLNSTQTPLFDKGRNLFGIDRAREAMSAERRAVVVEGYTDCIACHQHGIANVVATLGTALTDDQVNLLRRWCDEVILVFDADTAGQNAADRALGVALRHGLTVRIAQVTSGKDPAEFLETGGAEDFRRLLNSAEDALVFKWRRTCELFEHGSGGGRKEAIREFVHLVAGMARFRTVDPIQQGLIVNQLAKLLALPGREVHGLLVEAGRSQRSRAADVGASAAHDSAEGQPLAEDAAPNAPRDAEQAALVTVLQVLLNEPGHFAEADAVFSPARIADSRTRRIAEVVVDLCREVGEFSPSEVLGRFEDIADARCVTDLLYRGADVGNYAATLTDTVARLRQLQAERTIADAAQKRRDAQVTSPEQRSAEDEWLLRVQKTRKEARGFAPGIPSSTRIAERKE